MSKRTIQFATRSTHKVGARAMKREANVRKMKLRDFARECAADKSSPFHSVAKDWLRNKRAEGFGNYHPTKSGPGRA